MHNNPQKKRYSRINCNMEEETKSEKEYIFGIRAIQEAIRSDSKIDRLLIKSEGRSTLYHDLIEEARRSDIPVQFAPAAKLDKITRKNHQGAIAWLSLIDFGSLESLLPGIYEKGEDPLIVILDGITDVRNFGAIVRSADGMGAHAIVVPEKGSARAGGDAVKTSAGSLLHFPVCRTRSITKSVKFLKESGVTIVGASEKSTRMTFEADLTGPLAIIMGSEERGLSKELTALCDAEVKIPMKGVTASLNVSVAAGILLYEIARQRQSPDIKK
jgi:23S rRNA (guanosine2251-2'-O)-methyltransferase